MPWFFFMVKPCPSKAIILVTQRETYRLRAYVCGCLQPIYIQRKTDIRIELRPSPLIFLITVQTSKGPILLVSIQQGNPHKHNLYIQLDLLQRNSCGLLAKFLPNQIHIASLKTAEFTITWRYCSYCSAKGGSQPDHVKVVKSSSHFHVKATMDGQSLLFLESNL